MKLSHNIDLGAKRATAAQKIDAAFEKKARAIDPVPTLHAAKARQAHFAFLSPANAAQSPTLVAEAAVRGMALDALCTLIFAKDDAVQHELVALEDQRQQAQEHLTTLQSEQSIAAHAATVQAS